MASYNEFHNNNKRDSILVPIMNCGTSIFAGFVVFSVIGFMSHQTGLPIKTVATGGPGLAFVTYPEAIAMLPWPQFWAIIFFAMLFFLGLDSCVRKNLINFQFKIFSIPHFFIQFLINFLIHFFLNFFIHSLFIFLFVFFIHLKFRFDNFTEGIFVVRATRSCYFWSNRRIRTLKEA